MNLCLNVLEGYKRVISKKTNISQIHVNRERKNRFCRPKLQWTVRLLSVSIWCSFSATVLHLVPWMVFLMKSIIQCIITLCTLIQRFIDFLDSIFFTTLFYIKSLFLSQRLCQFHQILSVSLFCLLVGEIFWIYTFCFSNLRTIRSVYL